MTLIAPCRPVYPIYILMFDRKAPVTGGHAGADRPLSPTSTLRTAQRPGGGCFLFRSTKGDGAGSLSFWRPHFSDLGFYVNRRGSGLGKGRGRSVGERRGWSPEPSVDIGHGQRPRLAGRMTPAEIGHLAAGIRAIAGAGALRLERLVTPQTAPFKPSFTGHAASK
jgi:hypothetical protein